MLRERCRKHGQCLLGAVAFTRELIIAICCTLAVIAAASIGLSITVSLFPIVSAIELVKTEILDRMMRKTAEEPSPEDPDPPYPLSECIKDKQINRQTSSPLFSRLPPEIRDHIFQFALSTYADTTKPYKPNNWYYRSGYHAHPKISTSLLGTCRRIYLETHLLPLSLNEHVFWGSDDRGPPYRYFGDAVHRRTDIHAWSEALTEQQRGAVGEIHLFAQQFFLESMNLAPDEFPPALVTTKKFTITIRHQDWYDWEDDEPLAVCPWLDGQVTTEDMEREMAGDSPQLPRDFRRVVRGWGRMFLEVGGLEEVELEFETLTKNKEQLDRIVKWAKTWVFPRAADFFAKEPLYWDPRSGIKTSMWSGRRDLWRDPDGDEPDAYGEDTDADLELDELDYEDYYEEEDNADEGSSLASGDWPYDSPGLDGAAVASDTADEAANAVESSPRVSSSTEVDEAEEVSFQGSTLHEEYHPPHVVEDDEDVIDSIEQPSDDEETSSSEVDEGGDVAPPTVPLLLESNEQDYYVVSMIWRKAPSRTMDT